MPTSAHGPPDLTAARRITDRVRLRAEFHEAVGIAQVWGDEGPVHALTAYSARHSATECTAEAARVRAIVDAAADNRADPDWRD
jgi:hypothetical protein